MQNEIQNTSKKYIIRKKSLFISRDIQQCHKKGADSTFTEMARVSALARGNKSTLESLH